MSVTWKEAHSVKWAAMSDAERAEFEAFGPEVAMELRAAELVYDARQSAGLTQAELAQRMGTRQAYISALECGERTPTMATLARVAAATGKTFTMTIA
jgi:ribosome-binding protein aMBF1 (putative translation factor)